MDQFVYQAFKKISQSETVVDVGGGSPYQKDMEPVKDLFGSATYISIDRSYVSSPTIRADIHSLPIKSSTTGGVICKAVLEHVTTPAAVVDEIYRILKPSGQAYFWVPFLYPYHGNNDYDDYYRYTSAGMKWLLRSFEKVDIVASKGYWDSIFSLFPSPVDHLLSYPGKLLDKVIRVSQQNAGWHILATK